MVAERFRCFLHQTSYRSDSGTQGPSLSFNSSDVHYGKSSCRTQYGILCGGRPHENRQALYAEERYSERHRRRVYGRHNRGRIVDTDSDELWTIGGWKFRQGTIRTTEKNGNLHFGDKSHVVDAHGPLRYRQDRFLSTVFSQGEIIILASNKNLPYRWP